MENIHKRDREMNVDKFKFVLVANAVANAIFWASNGTGNGTKRCYGDTEVA